MEQGSEEYVLQNVLLVVVTLVGPILPRYVVALSLRSMTCSKVRHSTRSSKSSGYTLMQDLLLVVSGVVLGAISLC
jgi:hypothetical protein